MYKAILLFALSLFHLSTYCQTNPPTKYNCEELFGKIEGITTLCIDQDSTNLSILVTGGTQPYQYKWSDGSTNQDAVVSISATVYPSVTVTDSQGCKMRKSVQLKRITSVKLKIMPESPSLCPDSDITLNSFYKSDSYEWINLNDPDKVLGRNREFNAKQPGNYQLRTSLTKNGATCNSIAQTKVYDFTNGDEIEEYLLQNHFYAIDITLDNQPNNANTLNNFIPFKFSGIHEKELNFIDFLTTQTTIDSTLVQLRTVKDEKNKKSILTTNKNLCNNEIIEYDKLFDNSRIAVWFHQLESENSKLYLKAKKFLTRYIPINKNHENHLRKLESEIFHPKNNTTTEEQLRVICSNLLMY